MKLTIARLASPLGRLCLVSEGDVLRALDFEDCESRMRRVLQAHYGPCVLESAPVPPGLRNPLRAYFSSDVDALARIRVATGGTSFQRRIWKALREIPPGRPISYGRLAARVGAPNAARAVGAAVGANPVAIVVPCHRVVGGDGTLTGYAGGLKRKRWLLGHEAAALEGLARETPASCRRARMRRFLDLDRINT